MNRVGRSLLAVTSGPRRPPATATRGRTAGYTYPGHRPPPGSTDLRTSAALERDVDFWINEL